MLFACAALLYQTSAVAASLSTDMGRAARARAETRQVQTHQTNQTQQMHRTNQTQQMHRTNQTRQTHQKNSKVAYHHHLPNRPCKYNDEQCKKAQRYRERKYLHHAQRRGDHYEKGGYNSEGFEQRSSDGADYNRANYNSYPEDNRPARDFNGARDFPGESGSEESFLGDHR